MQDEVLIDAKGMQRYYNHYCALKAVDIRLKKGEVLGLLGPNGAGKSTTMQILTGNLAPSRGEIHIKGIDLLEQPQKAKQHIGYLPERPPLYRDMRVDEYLNYCAKLRAIPTREQKAALEKAKSRCGLTQVGRRLIANLSKGFQQRVGIAQAILHTPDIIILDEPTVGLDPIQIQEIRTLIQELGKNHSVILSTHILPEVQAVCDRVQIIHEGSTVFDDSLSQLEQGQSDSVLLCRFAQAIDTDKLSQLKDIEVVQVDNQARNCYQIHHRVGKNIVPAICQLAQQESWEIQALSPQRITLEQIFMNLIHGEKDMENLVVELM
jgi:ABC-2 type transport system ATP-binding protein